MAVPPAPELLQAVHALVRLYRGSPGWPSTCEAPKRFRYSRAEEERLADHLRLAERLGAEVLQIQPSGLRAAPEFLALARSRKVTTILLGRSRRPRWLNRFTGSFLEDLVHGSREIEVRVIPTPPRPRRMKPSPLLSPSSLPGLRRLGTVGLAVVLTTTAGFRGSPLPGSRRHHHALHALHRHRGRAVSAAGRPCWPRG